MSKKLFLAKAFFLFIFLLALSPLKAQTASAANDKNKTVVYLLNDHTALTAQKAVEIDKTLISKKGILSSSTNVQARTVTVKVQDTFPEEEIKKLLASVLHIEVRSYKILNTTK